MLQNHGRHTAHLRVTFKVQILNNYIYRFGIREKKYRDAILFLKHSKSRTING